MKRLTEPQARALHHIANGGTALHPSTMQMFIRRGWAEQAYSKRPCGDQGYGYITPAGREALARHTTGQYAAFTKPREWEDDTIHTVCSPELLAQLQEGIAQAERGEVVSLGSFAQYLDDDNETVTLPVTYGSELLRKVG